MKTLSPKTSVQFQLTQNFRFIFNTYPRNHEPFSVVYQKGFALVTFLQHKLNNRTANTYLYLYQFRDEVVITSVILNKGFNSIILINKLEVFPITMNKLNRLWKWSASFFPAQTSVHRKQ
jgi:hypothetical protein